MRETHTQMEEKERSKERSKWRERQRKRLISNYTKAHTLREREA
jgi:hypothetical protein